MALHERPGPDSNGRSLGGALRDVWHDTSTLLSQHAEVAAAELSERTSGLAVDAMLLVAGVVVLHAGALAAVAAAAFALHEAGLAPWRATLTAAAAVSALGVGLVWWSRGRLQRRTAGPSDTLLAFKESKQWLTSLTPTRRA
jgi:Putative Actinobacterial Holin-X, holin superfamily III